MQLIECFCIQGTVNVLKRIITFAREQLKTGIIFSIFTKINNLLLRVSNAYDLFSI